ncbi:hypothetical protein NPIL_633711 [Nephila pilipes]|uniref:Uncharacterized protein n=1 Tax=Nephila pilipes TaxID=299642 RepID=A0A8X6UCG2_NEPPI|nr:hypothetical protein NPIL_633711 [Nephila pilipes]
METDKKPKQTDKKPKQTDKKPKKTDKKLKKTDKKPKQTDKKPKKKKRESPRAPQSYHRIALLRNSPNFRREARTEGHVKTYSRESSSSGQFLHFFLSSQMVITNAATVKPASHRVGKEIVKERSSAKRVTSIRVPTG